MKVEEAVSQALSEVEESFGPPGKDQGIDFAVVGGRLRISPDGTVSVAVKLDIPKGISIPAQPLQNIRTVTWFPLAPFSMGGGMMFRMK